jgi:hypothetical protein
MVMRVFPFGAGTTAPRLPLLKLYSFFILFLIHFSLTRGGFACGNNTNDNLSKRVYHDQNSTQKIPANGYKTVFTFMLVLNRDGIFVLEYTDSIRKLNAVLLVI